MRLHILSDLHMEFAPFAAPKVDADVIVHTHHCVDYSIGRTRVLSNQRGYPDTPVPGFDPGLVVEI